MRRLAPGIVYSVALFAYVTAVMQRSSLGVAGVLASERFETSATVLSTLAVSQLFVYAALQIPVGMLLDRFGPTRLILTGAILMAIGQTIVAVPEDFIWAVVGRMLVGAGDATTFVSGLRVITGWFEPKRVPVMTQWYGTVGQIGQILSAVPFAFLLNLAGWTPAFLSVAAISVLVLIAGILVLRDSPHARIEGDSISLSLAISKLRDALRRPGTHLGFWSHFTLQFPGTVFALFWGYPLMVQGLGYSAELASLLLPVLVIAGMLLGPTVGVLTASYPLRRSTLVLSITVVMIAAWSLFLLWPGEPPLWYLVVVLVVTGAGATGSAIGFDFARTFNPARSFGSASGIVNVGGFAASFSTMFFIGVGVDVFGQQFSPGAEPTWQVFSLAMWLVPIVLTVGGIGVYVSRQRTRSKMAEDEGIEVAPLWVALVRRWRQRKTLN